MCNDPYNFEWLMDVVLDRWLGVGCLVYLDGIMVYGVRFLRSHSCLKGVIREASLQ